MPEVSAGPPGGHRHVAHSSSPFASAGKVHQRNFVGKTRGCTDE